jgi:ABC-2 type transport system ATP-binding protein
VRVRLHDPGQRPQAGRVLSQALAVAAHLEPDPAALSARASDPERVADALGEPSRAGVAVAEFALGQPSLDEVFLTLTGRPAEDDAATEDDAA